MTDFSALVAGQRQYFNSGATRPVAVRKEMLRRLRDGLEARESALLSALAEDLGKSAFEAYETELGMVRAELRHALRRVERWARPRRVSTPPAHFPARSQVCPEPYGVSLILSPWNYPLQLTLVPLISALAAGCTAVVKPSAYAPATSRAVAELLEACFDRRYVAVVQGGRAENAALLEEHFDFIFFTGSTQVGRTVMAAAARHLTPVALELGGKSPTLLCADADLDLAARRIAWGKFLNAGQTCVAPDHVWVPAHLRDAFVDKLGQAVTRFYGPRPLESPDLPKIINEKHFVRLRGLMASGRTAVGGGWDEHTRRIEPTVLVDVSEADPVMGEEIFGPILPVLTYEDWDGLLAHLREKPRPLALYVFSNGRSAARQALHTLSFGGGCWNDTIIHLANGNLPFGGIGESGMGRCHGEWGFRTFSHEKGLLHRYSLDVPVRYPPHAGKGLGMLKKLM